MSALHYDTFSRAVEATPEVSNLPQSLIRERELAELFATEEGPALHRRHNPARFDAELKAMRAGLAKMFSEAPWV